MPENGRSGQGSNKSLIDACTTQKLPLEQMQLGHNCLKMQIVGNYLPISYLLFLSDER